LIKARTELARVWTTIGESDVSNVPEPRSLEEFKTIVGLKGVPDKFFITADEINRGIISTLPRIRRLDANGVRDVVTAEINSWTSFPAGKNIKPKILSALRAADELLETHELPAEYTARFIERGVTFQALADATRKSKNTETGYVLGKALTIFYDRFEKRGTRITSEELKAFSAFFDKSSDIVTEKEARELPELEETKNYTGIKHILHRACNRTVSRFLNARKAFTPLELVKLNANSEFVHLLAAQVLRSNGKFTNTDAINLVNSKEVHHREFKPTQLKAAVRSWANGKKFLPISQWFTIHYQHGRKIIEVEKRAQNKQDILNAVHACENHGITLEQLMQAHDARPAWPFDKFAFTARNTHPEHIPLNPPSEQKNTTPEVPKPPSPSGQPTAIPTPKTKTQPPSEKNEAKKTPKQFSLATIHHRLNLTKWLPENIDREHAQAIIIHGFLNLGTTSPLIGDSYAEEPQIKANITAKLGEKFNATHYEKARDWLKQQGVIKQPKQGNRPGELLSLNTPAAKGRALGGQKVSKTGQKILNITHSFLARARKYNA